MPQAAMDSCLNPNIYICMYMCVSMYICVCVSLCICTLYIAYYTLTDLLPSCALAAELEEGCGDSDFKGRKLLVPAHLAREDLCTMNSSIFPFFEAWTEVGASTILPLEPQ